MTTSCASRRGCSVHGEDLEGAPPSEEGGRSVEVMRRADSRGERKRHAWQRRHEGLSGTRDAMERGKLGATGDEP